MANMIYLHDTILKSKVAQNGEVFLLFTHLLFNASLKREIKFIQEGLDGVKLDRGECVVSIPKLTEALNTYTEHTAYLLIQCVESGAIELHSYNDFLIAKINNFSIFIRSCEEEHDLGGDK